MHEAHGSSTRTFLSTSALLITSLSLLANIGFLLNLKTLRRNDDNPLLSGLHAPYSPADEVTNYQLKSINAHDPDDLLGGPPSHLFDQAWSHLLAPSYIKVTGDELRKANKKSVKLRDQDQYIGYLEVYHQLHCVKRMVQIRWPEKYPELTSKGKLSQEHFNHCVQVLVKGIMCNADTSLNTVVFDPNNNTTIKGVTDSPRKCVNWERLDAWARERALGLRYDMADVNDEDAFGPRS